jgi:hypothetical protein
LAARRHAHRCLRCSPCRKSPAARAGSRPRVGPQEVAKRCRPVGVARLHHIEQLGRHEVAQEHLWKQHTGILETCCGRAGSDAGGIHRNMLLRPAPSDLRRRRAPRQKKAGASSRATRRLKTCFACAFCCACILTDTDVACWSSRRARFMGAAAADAVEPWAGRSARAARSEDSTGGRLCVV